MTNGELTGNEIIKNVENAVASMPGVIVEITPEEGGPGFDSPIELGIFGNNDDQVSEATQRIEKYLQEDVVGLMNIIQHCPTL